ncbi:molybdenum cofactor sulfurase-like [Lytechinus variegatus]|uniref:molybdenum cofactor sulfurase-like n=1 Tax=Lytechinus variegatus TaxID=7654 RepID=UPI001BB18143|nr:molybdenum cofactor sulfurase-like [Lytechinus variegatus]
MISSHREDEFPQIKNAVYLDHTGATLPCSSQLEGFHRDMRENLYGNPHSHSSSSSLCTETIDQTRFRILKYFNTTLEKHTVIFTSGCTGALKLLAESFDWSGFKGCHQTGRSSSLNHYDNHDHGQKRGIFCYLQDNHTSVVGMREIAHAKGADSLCLSKDTMKELFTSSISVINKISSQDKNNGKKVDGAEYNVRPQGLFAYPAQSNYCGYKYPLQWTKKVQDGILCHHTGCYGNWYVVLDAAAFVSTSPLDLSSCDADFVTISFYKMFGFPTGLGALIVRNDSAHVLVKEYFGGGTVMAYLAKERFNKTRMELAERLEDGTVPFLDIVSLRHGFDALKRHGGGMKSISEHTFLLAKYVYDQLSTWKHHNGQPVCEIYNCSGFESSDNQGPIINFNLLRSSGEHSGYAEFERLASLHDIHLRTGCFCNTGACQYYLNITDQDIKDNLDAGHVCGDDMDLINGRPTGSVRISFGYMSNQEDADRFLTFVKNYFVEKECQTISCSMEQSDLMLGDTRIEQLTVSAKSMSPSSSSKTPTIAPTSSPLQSSSVLSPPLQTPSVLSSSTASKPLPTLQPPSSSRSSSPTSSKIVSSGPQNFPSVRKQTESETRSSKATSQGERTTNEQSTTNGPRLLKIFLYPVKSCGAMEVSEWELSEAGLKYDRRWMIVNDGGVYMSQKRIPHLCLIKPSIDLVNNQLLLAYKDKGNFTLPLDIPRSYINETSLSQGKVCGDRVNTIDCGDGVAAWLTEVIGQRCRLQQQDPDYHRSSKLNKNTAKRGSDCSLSLANQSQYLLVTASSSASLLSAVNQSSNQESHQLSLDDMIARFRSNLVVEGCSAFEEESWSKIAIGGQDFEVKGCCNRCQMICINQDTAEKGTEPLCTLSAVRSKKIFFGVHLMNSAMLKEGVKLRKGDAVKVLHRIASSETTV